MRSFQPDPSSYEIERNRGEGLSATVCKAVRLDPRKNVRQVVALKIPKDRTEIADLRHEFEALTRVNSRNCARALAWETEGSNHVLVLEWIEGPTLFELAAGHFIPENLQKVIIAQIAAGLRDLQRVGQLHGDLHPGNVMIGADGVVRLIDFANRAKNPDKSVQLGVPAFLSPELRKGNACLSYESDLFALGVIERGLKSGFTNLKDVAESTDTGLCAEKPWNRVIESESRDLQTSLEDEQSLKDFVRAYCDLKKLSQTQVLSDSSMSSKFLALAATSLFRADRVAARLVGGLLGLVFLSALSISVRAEAPLIQPVSDARLTITTTQWAEISLNGKSVGYSPVRIGKLSSGFHRLSWSSAFGAGSLVLELKSGEFKLIDERALRSHSQP